MKTNICLKCNKEFLTNEISSKFCSVVCRASQYAIDNKEGVKLYKKQYHLNNKQEHNKRDNQRYYANKQKLEDRNCLNCSNKFAPNRKDKFCCSKSCSDKHWKSQNVDFINKWHKNYYNTNLNRRLATCLRSRLNKALKGNIKSIKTMDLLGCSVEEFKLHLESKFESWMTWNNYGNGKNKWNVDHIVPLDAVDLTKAEDLKKVCHFTNLRPLLAKANSSKGAKV